MSKQSQPPKILSSRQRLFYTLMPLLILLLVMLLINMFMPNKQQVEVVSAETAVPIPTPQPPAAGNSQTRPPILPAIILPTPTSTAQSRPQLPASANITLVGPPNNSSFAQNGRISFYWTFSEQLQPGQQFVFILGQNDQELVRRNLPEANLGSGYQVQIDLRELTIEQGTAIWQIGLRWTNEEQWLLVSNERNLNILP